MENKEELEKMKENIDNFIEENKINLFCVSDELLNATDLGKTYGKGGRAVNLILNKEGFLKENDNKEDKEKWRLTEKGKKYAVTPIKFIVSITKEGNLLIRLKVENPKWLGKMKIEFDEIMKKEENKNGTK